MSSFSETGHDSPFASRILVLVPHADDEVVGVATFIGEAVRRGCEVFTALLTDGVPAAELLWPWQRRSRAGRVQRRQAEACAAGQMLGLETVLAQGIATRTLRGHLDTTVAALTALVRQRLVECIWVPAYEGGHQDHDTANFIGALLAAQTPVWEFCEYHFAPGRVVCNTFITASGGEQTLTLDAAQRVHKRRALQLYRSERGNLGYVDVEREQLRPLQHYDYAAPPHAGRTFYQRYQWVPAHPRIDYTTPAEVCAALVQFAAQHVALTGANLPAAESSDIDSSGAKSAGAGSAAATARGASRAIDDLAGTGRSR